MEESVTGTGNEDRGSAMGADLACLRNNRETKEPGLWGTAVEAPTAKSGP